VCRYSTVTDPKTGAGILSEEQVFFRAKAPRTAKEEDVHRCKRAMETGDAAVKCVVLRGEIAREVGLGTDL
jgi:hypothetical protein